MRASRLLVLLAWGQGLYFAATGAWALIDINSFQTVTGPKTDVWLVRAVSVLVLAIGLTLALAAWRLRVGPEVALLAVASAAGLGVVDVVYALDGTIRAVYLADAAVEAALVLGWGVALWRAGPELWAWSAQVRPIRGRTP